MTAPTPPPEDPKPHPDPPANPPPTPEPVHHDDGLVKRVEDLEAIVQALVHKPDTNPAGKPWTHKGGW